MADETEHSDAEVNNDIHESEENFVGNANVSDITECDGNLNNGSNKLEAMQKVTVTIMTKKRTEVSNENIVSIMSQCDTYF